jgi:hypothetical protein
MTASPWHPLIETREREAAAILDRALALEPRLTVIGVGVLNESYKRATTVAVELEEQRAALRARLDHVAACADWIKLQRHLNHFTPQTSYARKHDIETWFRVRGGPPLTVSNGAVIAAALGLGIEVRLHGTGPNVMLKLAEGPPNIEQWERERVQRRNRDDGDGADDGIESRRDQNALH